MKHLLLVCLLGLSATALAQEDAQVVETPYEEPKVVFDFYFDEPQKIGPALYWIRSLTQPLLDEPYGMAPEFMDLKVVLHGTEIVTVAKKNFAQYEEAVQRMRYYHSLGVEFKVCGLAADDYGYTAADLQPFIEVVPSAITELAHWQQQGYALITPTVMTRRHSIEDIR